MNRQVAAGVCILGTCSLQGLLIALVMLTAPAHAQSKQFKTSVASLSGENFAGSCSFELTLPAPEKPVNAVWLTYDRGYDISRYYSDPQVVAFAEKHAIALMLAHQCPAKEPPTHERGEMEMDPSRGVGRSIFAALDSLSQQTKHPEISSSKLIVLGFSGTGALFARFVGYAPDRVLAAILANSGQSDPYGMDRVNLPLEAIGVPELIIVGGTDHVGGTQRNYDYFKKYRNQGAPWIFLLQNGIPHCCVINAKLFVLSWLEEIIKLRKPTPMKPLRRIDNLRGWAGFVCPCDSTNRDHWGEPVWNVCGAAIRPLNRPAPSNQLVSGWFPDRKLAIDWLNYTQQSEHPANSFPNPPH